MLQTTGRQTTDGRATAYSERERSRLLMMKCYDMQLAPAITACCNSGS